MEIDSNGKKKTKGERRVLRLGVRERERERSLFD
jgi:hypothetical protein